MIIPFITVIIVVHRKRQNYLPYAIESVLNQTLNRTSYEIILVKDFEDNVMSNDLSKKGVQVLTLLDDRESAKLALGISYSKGEVLCFLEDDDAFDSNKLSDIFTLFSLNHDIVFYKNKIKMIDQSGIEIVNGHNKHLERNKFGDNACLVQARNRQSLSELVKLESDFNISSISIRKSILLNHLQQLSSLHASFDVFFMIIAYLSKGEMFADQKCLTFFRVHGFNMSKFGEGDIIAFKHHLRESLLSDTASFKLIASIVPNSYSEVLDYTWLRYHLFKSMLILTSSGEYGRSEMAQNLLSAMKFLWGGYDGRKILLTRLLYSCIFIVSPSIALRMFYKFR